MVVIDCLLESSPSSPEDNTDGKKNFLNQNLFRFFSRLGESTIANKRVSETGDDYVDLTLDALSLMNTKSSLNYAQIEPLELNYISMEEIIRVGFLLFSVF